MNRLKAIAAAGLIAGGIGILPAGAPAANAEGQDLILEVPIQSIEVRTPDETQQGTTLDLVVLNVGDDPVEADVSVEGPDDWQASLFHKFKLVSVSRLSLTPGERAQDLEFRFVTPPDVKNGPHTFSLRFTGPNGALIRATDFVVVVDIPEEQVEVEVEAPTRRLSGGFEFDTRFSSLTTPVDEPIDFRVNIRSRDPSDLNLGLEADAPLGWRVAFRPSFQDADIRAIAVRPGGAASVDVVVTAPATAAPGVYPVVIRARPGGVAPREIALQVELRGVPDLRLTTATGLLTVDANAGATTDVEVRVVNAGAAADNVRFVTAMPPGWGVKIDHNPVPRVEANGVFDVTVSVTPPDKTIPGDYEFQLIASVEGQSTGLIVGVTVVRSDIFAILGIALIGVVVLGLGGLFFRLSRP
jgi:uncharacterized membrane protein